MNRTKQKKARLRSLCTAIVILHIFLLIGTAGSLELERISISQGIWQTILLTPSLFLFGWLSGGFSHE